MALANRFWIFAMALSRPGTMGGNSKIALETARWLSATGSDVHLVVLSDRLETVEENLSSHGSIALHVVEAFSGNDKYRPISAVMHFIPQVRSLFQKEGVGSSDIVWGISEFHNDVLPLFWLKREFGFRWIASFFLFVPFVVENLCRGYRFPAVKYLVYWIYERILFRLACMRADAFVITNDTDRKYFSQSVREKVFAFYGGVNVDQIPTGAVAKTRDVVFCSRLHPQKGIDGFLDVWQRVLASGTRYRLTVIGNGAPEYETYLRKKAERLGIADTIDWLGYVNNEAKYAIYRSAKVMVHPTVFDNNGMVAAEALCSGLPVVMYDLPALRDVYTVGCVKVPFGDKAAFAVALEKLLKNPDLAAPSSAQVAELRAKWDWKNRTEAFAAFLAK